MKKTPKFLSEFCSPSVEIKFPGFDIINLSCSQGYRTAIATCKGTIIYPLYYEAEVKNTTGYARVGVAKKNAELYGPVGMDSNGYSFGNKNGYFFHRGKRMQGGGRYGQGMCVSVLMYENSHGRLTLEYYVDGVRVGNKIDDICTDEFFPAISLYYGCQVSVNFGPYLRYETKIMNEQSEWDVK